jgi:hypothetical protein
MNKFEQGILYVFSFFFFPIGVVMWIVTLYNQNQQMKTIGRKALYCSIAAICFYLMIGILNFVRMTIPSSA